MVVVEVVVVVVAVEPVVVAVEAVAATNLRRPELDGAVAELRCPLLALVLQRRRRLLHRLEAGVVGVVGAGLGHHPPFLLRLRPIKRVPEVLEQFGQVREALSTRQHRREPGRRVGDRRHLRSHFVDRGGEPLEALESLDELVEPCLADVLIVRRRVGGGERRERVDPR